MDVFDGAVDTEEGPVGVVAEDADVEFGGEAMAKTLGTTVAIEVAPEGVMVSSSARTPTTLFVIE